MSQPNDARRDELEDRLMDQALREVLGGQSPPDLSARILAAAEKQIQVSPQPKERVMDKPKRSYRRWVIYIGSACVLVAALLTLLLQYVPPARESGHLDGVVAYGPSAPAPATSDHDGETSEPASCEPPLVADPFAAPPEVDRGVRGEPDRNTLRVDEESPSESIRNEKGVFSADLDIPFANEPPVVYPSREVWKEVAGRRKEDLSTESGRPLQVMGRPVETPNSESAAGLRMMVEPRVIIQGDDSSESWGTSPQGQGPGRSGDKYDRVVENPFQLVKDHPLSTFSIDVDTASYANVRRFLLQEGRLPPPDAVRIEELVNYFHYDYAGPEDDVPFASHIEVAACPWAEGHRLVRVGLKGKEIENEDRPESNLVFLLDVSGSMNSPDKLPLLREGMKLLAMQMRPNDRVAIVVYAGSEGLALPSTPGSDRRRIIEVLDRLQSGGSTAGGAGIELAYRVARENFITGGVNRVILCTDGDFNVGTTSTADLERMVEEKAKSGVFLSVLGFGRGNLNDAMMETISNKGNGNYAYIDGITEAYKVLVEQLGGTLVTIAKDVKIQIEFNPAKVAAYRLIGYENRMLAKEDFNDDKKDAGEIGAGHTVTALYELVPAGGEVDVPGVDPLKYQPAARTDDESASDDRSVVAGSPDHATTGTSDELLTLKLRYKQPDGDTSRLLEFPVKDAGRRFGEATGDMQFAASVAAFGMLLRGSQHAGTANYDAVLEIASSAKGPDTNGYRAEFLDMVRRAKSLSGR